MSDVMMREIERLKNENNALKGIENPERVKRTSKGLAMPRFLAGVLIGFISFGIYTAFYPLGLRSTIRKLVELDYGEYNSKTGEFVLKECKKD